MALKQLIEKLGHQKAEPALTLSMQTHRTHPDNTKDPVLLKNLVKEAESQLQPRQPAYFPFRGYGRNRAPAHGGC